MNMIECLGLECLTEKEENVIALLNAICSEGKAIVGYYGYPYFNREYGLAQFIVRTELNEKDKCIEFTGLDTHLSGITVWDVLLSGLEFQPKDADCLSRRVAVKRVSDGGGLAIVNLVNADVLPSFLENDRLHIQIVGFPEKIHYSASEEEYAAAQPEAQNKMKYLLADGAIFASGLLKNHALDNPDKDKDHYSDNFMLIRGTVKALRPGRVEFGGETFTPFISAVIHTEFGDLQIVHTLEQVEESERENIKVGATVWGVFVLSGDVAIDDYTDGIVLDEEHNLALLRYILQKGDPRRLKTVLTEDAVYVSEASGQEWSGREAIVDRLQYVSDSNPDMECFAHLATVTSVDDGEEALPYGAGKRCVILSEGEENTYDAIVFIDQDDGNHITRLTISRNARYHFQIDAPIAFADALDEEPHFPEK